VAGTRASCDGWAEPPGFVKGAEPDGAVPGLAEGDAEGGAAVVDGGFACGDAWPEGVVAAGLEAGVDAGDEREHAARLTMASKTNRRNAILMTEFLITLSPALVMAFPVCIRLNR
jgi:hypothetical protein